MWGGRRGCGGGFHPGGRLGSDEGRGGVSRGGPQLDCSSLPCVWRLCSTLLER